MRCACRMRAYSSTLTILHRLWPGSPLGKPAGEPLYRRSLRVGPFSTRILVRGGPGLDEEYQVPKESLGFPRVGAQPDLRGPALPAVPDDPVAGRPSLDAGQEEAKHVQQQTLLLPHRPAAVEEDRDVVVVPQLRGAVRLLQPVEP